MEKYNYISNYRYLAYATPFGVEMHAPEYGIIYGVKENDATHYQKLLLKVAYTDEYVILTSEEAFKVYEFEKSGHYTEDESFTDESLAYFLELFDKYADILWKKHKASEGKKAIPEDVQKYISHMKGAEESLIL